MIQQPTLIASYPRSGSTWLRFILCHTFYPELEHTFATVNFHIPGLDDPRGVVEGMTAPLFYKTHMKRHGTSVIFLHRHVGDVLESEWWYKKKFHAESRGLEEYLKAVEFGKEWREFTDHYYPANRQIAFDELNHADCIHSLIPWITRERIEKAIKKSSFARLQQAEELGFGIYPQGDKSIKFIRNGTSGQWKQWRPDLRANLLHHNQVHLKMLGYEDI